MGTTRRRSRRRGPSPYSLLIALSLITIVVMLFAIARAGSHNGGTLTAAPATQESAETPSEPERTPTPRFARYDDLALRLPVDPNDSTAVAFHQASGDLALHLVSLIPDADMELAAELKAIPPFEATEAQQADPDVLSACALRLWRSNRTGPPDTAVDCGADAGSAVYSPVSGTVVLVKAYKLYDKYDDFEIHIRPDGRDDVDVVLIHVDELRVSEGDRVKAGVTRIAAVRDMSSRVSLQLGGYTPNGGDHVHVQLNAVQGGSLSGTDGS